MEFRTKVDIEPFVWGIDHSMRGMSVGSCFAENIAAKLLRAKFRLCANPFGVLFNPVSIANTLNRLHDGVEYTVDDLVQCGDLWCGFDFHGSFSSVVREDALARMNGAVDAGIEALQAAEYVIITFGTAWVYEIAGEPGRVVANCHKFPAKEFLRRRLSVDEIVVRYEELFAGALRGKRVIFTVSPVRHVKDGLPENALSKAILLEAAHELVDRHPQAVYFPAFEIVTDELRDYRFYTEDMVHPSAVAVEYVWERFREAAFSPRTRQAAAESEKIAAAMEHRPINPESKSHARFRASMLAQVQALAANYPDIDFSAEIEFF